MTTWLRQLRWVAITAVLALVPSFSNAQSIGGSIVGVVKDAAGPVSQAEVRIVNVLTGQSRVWLTDDRGRYELQEVPPGSYQLEVSKEGYTTFSTPTSNALLLKLAQVASVETITLNVAPVQETKVEVKAVDVAMTDSRTATLGTSFDENQIHALPTSSRDVNNLALLSMGASDATSFNFANTLVAFAVSGSRGRDNNFIIDSVDNNDPLFGGAATQFTNESIFSEFRILTGQFQAEYGRNSGSIVNVVSRQGERDFHSSLFGLGQNDGLNAMTKVEKQSELSKPARFYENRVGATVAGPIRRDSMWFFLSYQWDRARNDLSSQYPVAATVPTVDGLALLKAVNAVLPTATLTAFVNDPLISTLAASNAPCAPLDSFPFQNDSERCATSFMFSQSPQLIVPTGSYLVQRANVTDLRDHQGFARIDRNFGQRDSTFFRYLIDDFRIPLDPTASIQQGLGSDTGLMPNARSILADRTQNFGLAWTHASSRALNELRLAYSRVAITNGALDLDSQYVGKPAISISFTGVDLGAVASDAGALTLGADSSPSRLNSNVYQLQENYSFVRGRNSFKAGINFNETRSGLNQIPGNFGDYNFGEFQTFLDNQPCSFNCVLLFDPGGAQRFGNFAGRGGPSLPLRQFDQFYFFQDDIQVSSRLTLNLGLRYEYSSPSFNNVVERSASYPNGQQELDRVYGNFAPRLGFAWGIGRNTVLRGGFGIFYNPEFLEIALLTWQSAPISPFVSSSGTIGNNGVTVGAAIPSNSYPNLPFSPSIVTMKENFDCSGNSLPDGVTISPFLNCSNQNLFAKNLRNPYTRSFSLGIERQIGRNFLVEATYLGSIGGQLFQRIDANPFNFEIDPNVVLDCNPSFCATRKDSTKGVVTETTNGGQSSYNALQTSATKRIGGSSLWGGLSLSAVYTWSHTIDNASEIFGASSGAITLISSPGSVPGQLNSSVSEPTEDPAPFAQNPENTQAGERGNSSFDRRHRLALGFVWALPAPHHHHANVLLGNWGTSGVFTVQSGQPFSVLNSDGACSDTSVLGDKRPNIGNPHAPADTVALINNEACLDPNSPDLFLTTPLVSGAGPYINLSGQTVDPHTVRFVQVPITTPFGNAGRNTFVGPSTTNLDLSVFKTISFGERFKLQLRIEAFDLLNRGNPGLFAGNPILAGDQRVVSTAFSTDPKAPETITRSRLGGTTPENFIDAGVLSSEFGVPAAGTFLSQKYVTTASRRIQWSVKFSF